MAERRMFTQKIVDSDAFLDMPLSTQALYFHLNMRADDDGFVNNPKKIQRMIGASEDDLKLLIAKRFLLCFENGVVVIKHWRMHNLLRKDRYNPTQYIDQKETLILKDNGAYTEKQRLPGEELTPQPTDTQMATKWQPTDTQMATQYSIGKDSIGKCSKGKEKKDIRRKYGEYENVLLSDTDLEKLKAEFPNDYQQRIENLSCYIASSGKSYKNHLATIRNWARKDSPAKAASPVKSANPATNVREKSYSLSDIESIFEADIMSSPTAAESEEVRARAEALKQRLQKG